MLQRAWLVVSAQEMLAIAHSIAWGMGGREDTWRWAMAPSEASFFFFFLNRHPDSFNWGGLSTSFLFFLAAPCGIVVT